ncbi:hypothetical protein CSC3H3_10995 [Thalassospira marina]|uniref:SPOR domain-containing protein n=2 Tax=Thalassospira marina TaxID=2048283 RepID=A0ABM6Q9F5_9PROT|nr:hypothetical protein CSC3H3_10995 [Thalassospira marina]
MADNDPDNASKDSEGRAPKAPLPAFFYGQGRPGPSAQAGSSLSATRDDQPSQPFSLTNRTLADMDRKTLLGLITGACMLGLVLFFGGMLVGAGLFMGPDAPKNASAVAEDGKMELLAQNTAPRVQTEIAPRQSETLTPDSGANDDAPSANGDMSATSSQGVDAPQGNDPVGDLIAERAGEGDGGNAGNADSSDAMSAPDAPDVTAAPNAPDISDMSQSEAEAADDAVSSAEKSSADTAKAPAAAPVAPEIRKDTKPPKPVAKEEPAPAKTEKSAASETAASAALHREPGSKNMPYSIQVGAFKVDANARQRAGELRKKGLEVAVVERGTNDGAWYYVRVGAYPDATSARSGAEKVKKDTGIDGFPVRAEPNDKKID